MTFVVERAILESALLWWELHGNDAESRVKEMEEHMRAVGDERGAEAWQNIMVALNAWSSTPLRVFGHA